MILINQYYKLISSDINLFIKGTIREQSITFYLYHFMSKALFYLLLSPHLYVNDNFFEFCKNFFYIKASAELYLNKNLNDEIKKDELLLSTNIINDEFYELIDYKNQFKYIVKRLKIILDLFLNAIGFGKDPKQLRKLTFKKSTKFKIFFLIYNIFHSINKKFNLVDNKLFYNESLSKYLNLQEEYKIFLSNTNLKYFDKFRISEIPFTFLNYTWIFGPSAKFEIINLFNKTKQKENINNNINNYINYIVINPLTNNKYLRLNIKRDDIINEALNKIEENYDSLHYPLKIKFIGEEAEDEGGVRKEFFMLLIRELFDINYGMFIYKEKSRLFWFNINSLEEKGKFELIGRIIGLAIYNGNILDIKFPIAIYKKLLGIKPNLDDLKEYDEELYTSLRFLLNTEDKNLKENIESNFTVLVDNFGEKKLIPLKPNGENIMITYENKNEYVELYLNWFFNESIKEYYSSFEKGFYDIVDRNLLLILSPEELELIICGTQTLDYMELKKSAKYNGYIEDSLTIKLFWEILMEFNEEQKKKFLIFVTGSDRAPIDGLGSLPFTVNRIENNEELPSSHTCFNELILPDYKNKEIIKKKIEIAINYSEGFGLK